MKELRASEMKRGTKFKLKLEDIRIRSASREERRQDSNLFRSHLPVIIIYKLVFLLSILERLHPHYLVAAIDSKDPVLDRIDPLDIPSIATSISRSVFKSLDNNSSDDLLWSAESRSMKAPSGRLSTIKSSKQLRKLLTRPGLILSSIVPPTSFIKQLVLEKPNTNKMIPASNSRLVNITPHSSSYISGISLPPRIVTSLPMPIASQHLIDPISSLIAKNRAATRTGLLLLAASTNLQANRIPLRPTMNHNGPFVRGPPNRAPNSDQQPPFRMFDDELEDKLSDVSSDPPSSEETERDLDHIDQLIKDEFENRLNLNEHIVRDSLDANQSPQFTYFNGTNFMRAKGSTPSDYSDSSTTPSIAHSSIITTMAPDWSSKSASGSEVEGLKLTPVLVVSENEDPLSKSQMDSNLTLHFNGPGSIRPDLLAQKFEIRPLMGIRQETVDQNSDDAASDPFVPSDLETIAHLRLNSTSNGLNTERSRFARDNDNRTASLWPTNRIKAQAMQPMVHQMRQLDTHQQLSSNHLKFNANLDPARVSIERASNKPTAQSTWNHKTLGGDSRGQRFSILIPSIDQSQQNPIKSTDDERFYHESNLAQQHPVNTLSETLKRLRETKARIKQLQAEIDATNSSLLVINPSKVSSLSANKVDLQNTWTSGSASPFRLSPGREEIQTARLNPVPFDIYHKGPLTIPARLMVSAFGRAAQTAIATRLPETRLPITTNGPSIFIPSNTTTSSPIILSSSVTVAGSDDLHPATVDPLNEAHQQTSQSLKPDLIASITQSSYNNDSRTRSNTDNNREISTIASYIESQYNSGANKKKEQNSGSQRYGNESADNRIDTRAKLADELDFDANRSFQFRSRERPKDDKMKQSAANKRIEQSAKDPFRPESSNIQATARKINSNLQDPGRVVDGFATSKPDHIDTIDRMSSADRKSIHDKKSSSDSRLLGLGSNQANSTSWFSQSVHRFLDFLTRTFNWSSRSTASEQNQEARVGLGKAKLTTERVLYTLITFTCSMALICLLVVFTAIRCQSRKGTKSIGPKDEVKGQRMCSSRLDWRKMIKNEESGDRFRRDQLILDGTMRNVSLLARQHQTDAKRQVDKRHQEQQQQQHQQAQKISLPVPLFKQSCCHCVACSESWLFRETTPVDGIQKQPLCSSGYYHPAPRGKLPFGAASSVNKLLQDNLNNPKRSSDERSSADLKPNVRRLIGGTRMRMMSSIDEIDQTKIDTGADAERNSIECSCDQEISHKDRNDNIVNCSCTDGNHNSSQEASSPEVQESDCDNAFNHKCACYYDKTVNLGDSLCSLGLKRAAHERSILDYGAESGEFKVKQKDCTINNINRELDSISIIRSKATTSAKSVANCRSSANGEIEPNGSKSKNQSSSKCNGKSSAKVTTINGDNHFRDLKRFQIDESDYSEEESRDRTAEDDGELYGVSITTGAKMILSQQQAMLRLQKNSGAIKESNGDLTEASNRPGCCKVATSSSTQAPNGYLHETRKVVINSANSRLKQQPDHQTSLLSSPLTLAATIQKRLRYKLMGEQQQVKHS